MTENGDAGQSKPHQPDTQNSEQVAPTALPEVPATDGGSPENDEKPSTETQNGVSKPGMVAEKGSINDLQPQKSILVGSASLEDFRKSAGTNSEIPVRKSSTQKTVRCSVVGDNGSTVFQPGTDEPLKSPCSSQTGSSYEDEKQIPVGCQQSTVSFAANCDDKEEDQDISKLGFDEACALMKTIRRRKDSKRFNLREYKPMSKVVSIAFKVWLIRDIYPIESTFKCQFRVFLEWLDEAAVGLVERQKVTKEQQANLSIPEITIQNVLDFKVEDQSAAPEVINSESGHVAFQVLYSATLQMEYNMSLFPFDSQMLNIVLQMASSKDSDRAFYYQYCEVEEQKGLEEWKVHSNYGESEVTDGRPQVTFGVLIQRRSRYYVVNVLLLLFMISSMTFSLYVLRSEDFANRAMIFMAISLTQVTFKLSVENKLPKVAYSTSFDVYAMSCQALLCLTAVGHAVVAQLAKDDLDFAHTAELYLSLAFAGLWVTWNVSFALFSWRVKKVVNRPSHSLPHVLQSRGSEKGRRSSAKSFLNGMTGGKKSRGSMADQVAIAN
eukprot:gnl/MRDRNA2_/MRDRNA2_160972_c0_seq1.p1 gnl/MRDRNA2_/MRDRNA2_160972_c0~~gnl/MRDRNA2_/MRDRNA2_160972_c0_seq1.p1  ORF type:complete len:551 (-),score=105.57 gnl/MRDRNA2_/MRDRNA2_160972_c0_seq1:209-1861(-)